MHEATILVSRILSAGFRLQAKAYTAQKPQPTEFPCLTPNAHKPQSPYSYVEVQREIVSRVRMGIAEVTMWLTGLLSIPRKPVTHNYRQLSPDFLLLWVKVPHD